MDGRFSRAHFFCPRTGIPKATLLRILITLERQGLIWQRLADGLFRPSYQLQERSRRLRRVDHLMECAAPELEASSAAFSRRPTSRCAAARS